ncbi:reverse transcriptase [Trichonephila clavipes]|nr:reverse transcriptase [Trichonephila clavipes]
MPPITMIRSVKLLIVKLMRNLVAGLAPVKVGFLIDSQTAISALSSNTPTNCLHTIQCRSKIAELFSYGWTVTSQWVRSHVGIPDNERIDQKAKQGAESSQPEVPSSLRRAKSRITTYIDKCATTTEKKYRTLNCNKTMMFYSIDMNFFYSKDNLVALHFKYDQARRRFVEWAQNEIAADPDFHKQILFSDEAHFWLNGYVSKQNCRIWSEANPQEYVETPLHPEKLTVWCALWAGGILLQKR